MSEHLRDLPQPQDGVESPFMSRVLERLHAVDPELIEAVADARAEGVMWAVGARELIAPDSQHERIRSSLTLTHLPHARRDYEGTGLLQVAVHDWVGDYGELDTATKVTSHLRLAEDGHVNTAMILRYVTASVAPEKYDADAQIEALLPVPGMPRKVRVEEIHEGAGNPAKIRARAINVAYKIVELSQASETGNAPESAAA